MATCEDNEAHFNLAEAKTLVMKGQGTSGFSATIFENLSRRFDEFIGLLISCFCICMHLLKTC